MTLADTFAVARMLGVKPTLIHTWAHRYPGELPRRGRRHGRTLFALEDAQRLATRMNSPALRPTSQP